MSIERLKKAIRGDFHSYPGFMDHSSFRVKRESLQAFMREVSEKVDTGAFFWGLSTTFVVEIKKGEVLKVHEIPCDTIMFTGEGEIHFDRCPSIASTGYAYSLNGKLLFSSFGGKVFFAGNRIK